MTDDLFASASPGSAPLAERLRPSTLSAYVGQTHLLGKDKPLRRILDRGIMNSMILWGPPGVGKTSLARLVARELDYRFVALSAVMSGVKDLRQAVQDAESARLTGQATLLFIDEIHRFNKAQQDALLPFVENGLFTFIGATTENPSFEVNPALLSRAQVHVLHPLSETDLLLLMERALQEVSELPQLDDSARQFLAGMADGDARRLLNLMEALAGLEGPLSREDIHNRLPQMMRRFDKQGESFYDQISALHKSVRGSDPDAALYWFCRMLDGGMQPEYLARRIVRMAWEDIGLADPRAFQVSNDAAQTYERLGSPEGELALAQAVIYLAVAPKSNAGYLAFNRAKAFVRAGQSEAVPMHLRNAPTKLMKGLGYGKGYRYAHDEADGFAAGARYWPDSLDAQSWYQPVNRGLEIKIADKLAQLKQANAEARQAGSADSE